MEKFNFEEQMQNLEDIIEQIEDTSIPLEDSLSLYKKAMDIAVDCSQNLKLIEQQVLILKESLDNITISTFENNESED